MVLLEHEQNIFLELNQLAEDGVQAHNRQEIGCQQDSESAVSNHKLLCFFEPPIRHSLYKIQINPRTNKQMKYANKTKYFSQNKFGI